MKNHILFGKVQGRFEIFFGREDHGSKIYSPSASRQDLFLKYNAYDGGPSGHRHMHYILKKGPLVLSLSLHFSYLSPQEPSINLEGQAKGAAPKAQQNFFSEFKGRCRFFRPLQSSPRSRFNHPGGVLTSSLQPSHTRFHTHDMGVNLTRQNGSSSQCYYTLQNLELDCPPQVQPI